MIGEAQLVEWAAVVRHTKGDTKLTLVGTPATLYDLSRNCGAWPPAGIDAVLCTRRAPSDTVYIMSSDAVSQF